MILYGWGAAHIDIWSNPVLLAQLTNANLLVHYTRFAEPFAFHAKFILFKQIWHPFALNTYILYLAKK